MRRVEPNSVVLIQGNKVLLYGLNRGGTMLLDTYSRSEAIAIGEELIEAAIKIQRRTRRAAPSLPADTTCRNPGCGKPTGNGHVYCSRPCYVVHRCELRRAGPREAGPHSL